MPRKDWIDSFTPDHPVFVQRLDGHSIEEALRAYTTSTAYASFEEGIKGSLDIGKLADFVILEQDILSTPPRKNKRNKSGDDCGWRGMSAGEKS